MVKLQLLSFCNDCLLTASSFRDVLKFIESHHLKPAPVHAEPLPATAAKVQPVPAARPVPAASSRAPTGPLDDTGFTDIELTTMRSVIAKRLTLSKARIDFL